MMQRRSLLAAAAGAPLLGSAVGNAAGDARAAMSPAQIALFETPHLASLRPPLRLDYAFRREEGGKEPVDDTIRLALRASASAGGGCCDVAPEFLTGPRALRYPPAPNFHGNPLLLFALDRDTRELSAATGGTPNWFRNRFRQALAAAEVRPAEIEHDGRRVAASVIALRPYEGEPRAGRYQRRLYAFTLAEAVPGWIQAIRTELPPGVGAGAVVESIAFAGTAPLPEGAG
jgi:hypothetical protein